ncbi:MAG: DUF3999 family protein [Gemmatimonadales bacterium]
MRPTDRRLLLAVAALSACAAPGGYRYSAPIEITAPGTFVELPVPVSAYSRSVQPGLADVRVVDAGGSRVSFAWLTPRDGETQRITETRPATVYPLPPRPARGAVWQAPVEVTVRGDQIRVSRSRAEAPAGRRGGWLIDLGPDPAESPPADRIELEWSGPAEFTAAYTLETSDDLAGWQPAPGGQLISLVSASGPLTLPVVRLPGRSGRFVRLEWTDPGGVVPDISGARAVAGRTERTEGEAPETITLQPMPRTGADTAAGPAFDLGGELPVLDLMPRFAAGNLVVPAVVEGRSRLDEPWRPFGAAVFYRLERSPAEVSTSPPLQIGASVRYLRLVPDRRAAALDPAGVTLEVRARLAHLVFAMQSTAPFRLEVGSATAEAGALPEGVLVPGLAEERTRFGRARLGEWTESATVAQAVDRQSQIAALRPWLLWGVLLAGLAGLGLMVWRLAKQR